ncbi:MAG TPA: hypothetical protein VMV32_00960 [Ignavibacteriaceae bacterium]|nr:hypothetical protein [Ignavibacteriaceae bacterium]
MARIRTIKPEFWQNEELAMCSPYARLAAIGLLNIADDEGYFNANPSLIKSAIFPFTESYLSPTVGLPEDSHTIKTVLIELSKIGYIDMLKGVDGRTYAKVKNFLLHQKINNPSRSKIKEKIDLTEDYCSPTVGLPESYLQERKGKERKGTGKGRENTCQIASAIVTHVSEKDFQHKNEIIEIFEFWKLKMGKTNAVVLDERRRRLISSSLKKYGIEDCKNAIVGCGENQYNIENNHTSIDLIFRNSEKTERFIDLSKNIQSSELSFNECIDLMQEGIENEQG